MTTSHSSAAAANGITAHTVNSSNCDREQVQFPGAIQPHGLLLVLQEPDGHILQLSANVDAWLGMAPATLLGQPLAHLIGTEQAESLRQRLAGQTLSGTPVHLLRVRVPSVTTEFEVFAHRYDGILILEWEAATDLSPAELPGLYAGLRDCVAKLQAARSDQEFFDQAVNQVRAFTGFERVLIYQFCEDRSGVVRAESKPEGMPTYQGLRFPATDVPTPARQLLSRLWLRHLPDAAYTPVPLIPEQHPVTGRAVDLSHANLRSTSPLCNRYYLNMGVRATLMLTLLKDGELWGFLGCHHSTPKSVPHEVRAACESLAHMVSLLISAKEDAEHAAQALAAKTKIEQIVVAMEQTEFYPLDLASYPGLADALDADGAAVVAPGLGMLASQGATPSDADIHALTRWLDSQDDVFHTDRLAARYEPAQAFQSVGSGLLALRFPEGQGYGLWFRPEQIEDVAWAGDPVKPMEIDTRNGEARLGPRRSFEVWKDTIRGQARPWRPYHLEAAETLKRAIHALHKTQTLAQAKQALEETNQNLARSNAELESFAHTAAHDLKEPLRGIDKYSTLLKENLAETLPETEQVRLDAVLRLTGRMRGLIDALLDYSRLGRTPLNLRAVDMNQVVGEALDSVRALIESSGVEVTVQPDLPTAVCDPLRVAEVFTNLLANGIKYNTQPHKQLEIGLRDGAVFFVNDNGIGIEPRHQMRVFDLFQRLHGREAYGGGSGAGLAIAKKIVELHGGRIWVESVPGQGACFCFSLHPKTGG